MKAMVIAVLAVVFLMGLQGPVQAQQEVEPPAFPPMLEDRAPLVQPEPKPKPNPAQIQEQKPQTPAKPAQTRVSQKQVGGQSTLKRKTAQPKTLIGTKPRQQPEKETDAPATPEERQAPDNT